MCLTEATRADEGPAYLKALTSAVRYAQREDACLSYSEAEREARSLDFRDKSDVQVTLPPETRAPGIR